MSTRRRVAVVPHTHWDREWYQSYQQFRFKLVQFLDTFLSGLEADPQFRHFMLDGQMAVVDDYLEVRPEQAARLRRLASAGRLSMGPWYTLPDEFLVSGETLIRNLQLGLHRATAFGGAMPVGYLPDMFGHVAQMPQIFSQLGFEHAVVWRGVPSSITGSAFHWSAPDGSRVRAENLLRGYGGAAVPDDAKAFIGRVQTMERELTDALASDWMLFMNGADHQAAQPWLGRVVAEANDAQDGLHFEVLDLHSYLEQARNADQTLETWSGELRSSARANLLMGVSSTRVDVKQAAAQVERALEQLAEPLCALLLPAAEWPGELLDIAWQQVIRNAAHDSICACSSDDVVHAVLVRYREALDIAQSLIEHALAAFSRDLASPGSYVVNPSARARAGVVELDVPLDVDLPGAQELRVRRGGAGPWQPMRPGDVALILSVPLSQPLAGENHVVGVAYEAKDDQLEVTVSLGDLATTDPAVDAVRNQLLALLGEGIFDSVSVRFSREGSRRVLTRTGTVPGYGWAPVAGAEGRGAVVVEGNRIHNGRVVVEIDPANGAVALDGIAGGNQLTDGGDAGDTYNYCPPHHDRLVTAPRSVVIEVVESGPVRARVRIVRTYDLPAALDANGERTGEIATTITTDLSVLADDPLVRFETSWDNHSRDHRLRVHFPLPQQATTSAAECAFAITERGLTAEGGPSEQGLPTYPSRRFVRAGGLAFVHEGLSEYELIEGGSVLAVTLLRSTGMLSRGPMTTRHEPAGPVVPARHAQCLGPITTRYAVCVDGAADPYSLVEDAFLPLPVVHAPGGGTRAASGTLLSVTGPQVSAVRRAAGGQLEVRVFNPTDRPVDLDLHGRTATAVDLRGRSQHRVEGTTPLSPWRISTFHLDAQESR